MVSATSNVVNLGLEYTLGKLHSSHFSSVVWSMTTLFALSCRPSLLNHSCDPNCYRVYEGRTFILRAVKAIQPGEQVSKAISFCKYATYTASFLCIALHHLYTFNGYVQTTTSQVVGLFPFSLPMLSLC